MHETRCYVDVMFTYIADISLNVLVFDKKIAIIKHEQEVLYRLLDDNCFCALVPLGGRLKSLQHTE